MHYIHAYIYWTDINPKTLFYAKCKDQRDSIIGGPETAIMLWKPNKSLFQGSTSIGIHGQIFCLLFVF